VNNNSNYTTDDTVHILDEQCNVEKGFHEDDDTVSFSVVNDS
jgi:transposase